MKLGKQSYLADLLNGFDLLHIDPTKDPFVVEKVISLDVVIKKTVELIEYVEKEKKEIYLKLVTKWEQRKQTEDLLLLKHMKALLKN